MAKIKKILLRILIVILAIFTLLFAIQLIDQAINGKTYAKIDEFFKEIKSVRKNNICMRNANYVMASITKDKESGKYEVFSDKFYDSTIASCKSAVNELDKIKIPQDISSEKKILLKNSILAERKLLEKGIIPSLNLAQECEGYKSCVFNINKNANTIPFDVGLYLMSTINLEIHAKERLSVKYILGYPIEFYFDKQIKKLEQTEKDFLSKKKS